MKFHRLTIDQKILYMTIFIYPLLLYNMYNKIRNGIYKKLREFNFRSGNKYWVSITKFPSTGQMNFVRKRKIYILREIFTFAPIWFPHWPAWMCTISRMLQPFEMRLISARSFTRQLLTSKVGGGLWNTVYLTWRMYFQVHAVMTRVSTLMHISKDPLNISPMR